jgi:hypothetical protein
VEDNQHELDELLQLCCPSRSPGDRAGASRRSVLSLTDHVRGPRGGEGWSVKLHNAEGVRVVPKSEGHLGVLR